MVSHPGGKAGPRRVRRLKGKEAMSNSPAPAHAPAFMPGSPHSPAPGPRRVRRLKEPRPIQVRTDEDGAPSAIMSSYPAPTQAAAHAPAFMPGSSGHNQAVEKQSKNFFPARPSSRPAESEVFSENSRSHEKQSNNQNGWQPVSLLRRPWRIDQLWWRPGETVSRRYFSVAPEDGPPITLYQDLLTGRWYRQEY